MKIEAIVNRLKIRKQLNFKQIEEKEYSPHIQSKKVRKKKGAPASISVVCFRCCFGQSRQFSYNLVFQYFYILEHPRNVPLQFAGDKPSGKIVNLLKCCDCH